MTWNGEFSPDDAERSPERHPNDANETGFGLGRWTLGNMLEFLADDEDEFVGRPAERADLTAEWLRRRPSQVKKRGI